MYLQRMAIARASKRRAWSGISRLSISTERGLYLRHTRKDFLNSMAVPILVGELPSSLHTLMFSNFLATRSSPNRIITSSCRLCSERLPHPHTRIVGKISRDAIFTIHVSAIIYLTVVVNVMRESLCRRFWASSSLKWTTSSSLIRHSCSSWISDSIFWRSSRFIFCTI